MKSLVIGNGQIGSALFEIFSKKHDTCIRDFGAFECDGVEVLHIAFPYSEKFIPAVKGYIAQYKPSLTVIHSSVAVGTTSKLGDGVVHSPERGRYPDLAFEMRQFPKFIGGFRREDLVLASNYFMECDWPTVLVDDPSATELCKLVSNVHLGLEVAWRQEVERLFKTFGADSQPAYEEWEDSYNKGHEYLGQRHLVRPRLKPAPIGGHCILHCVDILSSQMNSLAFEFIRRSNAKRQTEIGEPAGIA